MPIDLSRVGQSRAPHANSEKRMTVQQLDLTEQVRGELATLNAETAAVTELVAKHRAHSKALDAYLAPLQVFVRNQSTDAYKASESAAFAELETREQGRSQLAKTANAAIVELVAELSPGTSEYDTSRGDACLSEVKDAIASKYVHVDDDAAALAGLASTAWGNAKRELTALNPARYRVASAGKNGTRQPRGPGALVESAGFRLAMECDQCGQVLHSGSNPGSAQNDMANHLVTAKHVDARPYAGNPQHADFTAAMNQVLAADTIADGGGFTISREYVAA